MPSWFPTTRDNSNGWRFDIVGLLAVIGESSIEEHVQVITGSRWCFAPRLIPAPQTLLKTKRPRRLPSVPNVEVFGVYSGTRVSELNYFANAIHKIQDVQDYEFRRYTIEYKKGQRDDLVDRVADKTFEHAKNESTRTMPDEEKGAPSSSRKDSSPPDETPVHIPMRRWSPIELITIFSVLLTIGLFVWAAKIHDGVACIAIGTISVSTSLACVSSMWRPQLSQRPSKADVPKGDVIIKTRGGAMIVVHCREEITRELYTATERCDYVVGQRLWSMCVATSTMLTMISVVLLGNCEWTMQAAVGVAYILLNGVYWALPWVLPEKRIWNMDNRFNITEHKDKPGSGGRHPIGNGLGKDSKKRGPSYTRTLALAIQATRDIAWVTRAGFAPSTPSWNQWLEQALKHLDDNWDAVDAKDELWKEKK